MSYRVRLTKGAKEDVLRLFEFLVQHDVQVAQAGRNAIARGMEFLKDFPFSCRKIDPDNPFLREMLISFGRSGYVALFEIENSEIVTILAVRHQFEEDYY